MKARLLLPMLLFAATACSARPVRFGDRPLAVRVRDDRPIPVPQRQAFFDELHQADVYVRRELVNALDPRRHPPAGDVNALDEVVESSWFDPRRASLDGYERDGPPRPPFRYLDEPAVSETPGARAISDARGLRYELLVDIRGYPGMRTGAAAVASRLVYALGYRTPEVHLVTLPNGEQAAATRWPMGIDLGPTPIGSTRPDDPNDVIDHRDRRTLRALQLLAAWLDIKTLPARMLRDAYIGAPGAGHVQHFIVGLDGALGVDRLRDEIRWVRDPDREDPNFFLRVFSFGLSPKPAAFMPETPWRSVGLLHEYVVPSEYAPSPPFEPLDRLQPADAYWLAKRIAQLSPLVVGGAVMAGNYEPPAQHWLLQILNRRRAQVVAWGFDRTTPVEVRGVIPRDVAADRPARLALVDLAIASRMMQASRSSYRVRYLDATGAEIAPAQVVRPEDARFVAPLPSALHERDYAIVRIHALRDDAPLPRPCEIHLRPRGQSSFTLAGIRR